MHNGHQVAYESKKFSVHGTQIVQQQDPYMQHFISDLEMQRATHGSIGTHQDVLMVHIKLFVPNVRGI